MIASTIHQPSNILRSTTFSKFTTPVKVTDRIALFEQKAPILFASTFHEPHKTIVNCDGNTIRSFLRSIGEKEAPPTLSPKLWRWASEWKRRVQKREEERKGDVSFYSLSESLDQLDAILYSDSTLLEIEALDLVSSANREKGDTDRSEEKDYDPSVELAALVSGGLELAKELESFTRLCGDDRGCSQTH